VVKVLVLPSNFGDFVTSGKFANPFWLTAGFDPRLFALIRGRGFCRSVSSALISGKGSLFSAMARNDGDVGVSSNFPITKLISYPIVFPTLPRPSQGQNDLAHFIPGDARVEQPPSAVAFSCLRVPLRPLWSRFWSRLSISAILELLAILAISSG
jgi:hypothetical protein